MPSRKKISKAELETDIDYSTRLESKLNTALDRPEPIFDLSDCNLDEIPPNIFPAIKVSRKNVLNLQNNKLHTLHHGGALEDLKYIKVLDISFNKFVRLPNNLEVLKNLEVFDASKNLLVEVPNSLGNMENLIWLNLSNNDLRSLPDSIGNLKKLEVLNLRLNPQLKYLPPAMGKLSSLVQCDIDPTVVYPPREIYKQGIPNMLSFLLNEFLDDTPSTSSKKSKNMLGSVSEWTFIEEQLLLHEKLKEEKQKQLMEIEKQIAQTHKQEVELQQHLKEKRQKLLEEVQQQQKAVDEELSKLQEKKKAERAEILKTCLAEEKRANMTVSKIVEVNKKKTSQIFEMWELERKQEEAHLFSHSVHSKALEKKKILVSMNDVMKSEINYLCKTSSSKRIMTLQTIAAEIANVDDDLQKVLKKTEKNQKHLIDAIRTHDELQKSAVAALLEKSDTASWGLTQEIFLVQQQLSDLTRIEVNKKKAGSEVQLEELNRSRMALANILVNLFEQKQERRKQLVDTMKRLEVLRGSLKDTESFWLEQYDKLLTSKSHEMVQYLQSLHPELVKEFFYQGVLHFLPFLKNIALSIEKLRTMDNNLLIRLGIKHPEERLAILTAVENFLISIDEEGTVDETEGSESEYKSALLPIMECVVCMVSKPNVLFVSCGHICCCYKCYLSISLCPLCRKPIDKIWDIEESN